MAGPHEVLGMSRLLGISTTEFLERYADNGGTTLRFDEDGRCVFLTEAGCRVHPRRPLVCRLYPLGRATGGAGDEKFAVFPRQEDCEAEFGTDGTIAEFLESQGVAPYVEWSALYGALYGRMLGLLDRLDVQGKVVVGEAAGSGGAGADGRVAEASADGPAVASGPLSSWQDVDASLAEYCAGKDIAVPGEVEAAIALHLRAMKEWLDDLESRVGESGGEGHGAS